MLERELTLSKQIWAELFMAGEVILTATRLDLCGERTFDLTHCLSEILTGIKELLVEFKQELAVELEQTLVPAGPTWSRVQLNEAEPVCWVGTC